eukprot:TRINITY_DN2762_c1_g2_i2.p1 TRINITY_DN2762_c1_g2~~TRINITY_DN2762_c1_g2_i2.p1  ORF type:complete len:1499 (+),score=-105.57 TRINITY_DN2762_c1_g2_i2:69-4565(+)
MLVLSITMEEGTIMSQQKRNNQSQNFSALQNSENANQTNSEQQQQAIGLQIEQQEPRILLDAAALMTMAETSADPLSDTAAEQQVQHIPLTESNTDQVDTLVHALQAKREAKDDATFTAFKLPNGNFAFIAGSITSGSTGPSVDSLTNAQFDGSEGFNVQLITGEGGGNVLPSSVSALTYVPGTNAADPQGGSFYVVESENDGLHLGKLDAQGGIKHLGEPVLSKDYEVEGLAYNPQDGLLYGALRDANDVDKIFTMTTDGVCGSFIPVHAGIQEANSSVAFKNIEDITFDTQGEKLFAVMSKEEGETNYLVEIDPSTGKQIGSALKIVNGDSECTDIRGLTVDQYGQFFAVEGKNTDNAQGQDHDRLLSLGDLQRIEAAQNTGDIPTLSVVSATPLIGTGGLTTEHHDAVTTINPGTIDLELDKWAENPAGSDDSGVRIGDTLTVHLDVSSKALPAAAQNIVIEDDLNGLRLTDLADIKLTIGAGEGEQVTTGAPQLLTADQINNGFNFKGLGYLEDTQTGKFYWIIGNDSLPSESAQGDVLQMKLTYQAEVVGGANINKLDNRAEVYSLTQYDRDMFRQQQTHEQELAIQDSIHNLGYMKILSPDLSIQDLSLYSLPLHEGEHQTINLRITEAEDGATGAENVVVAAKLTGFDLSKGLSNVQLGGVGEAVNLNTLDFEQFLNLSMKDLGLTEAPSSEADLSSLMNQVFTAYQASGDSPLLKTIEEHGAYFVQKESGMAFFYLGAVGDGGSKFISYDVVVGKVPEIGGGAATATSWVLPLGQSDTDLSNNMTTQAVFSTEPSVADVTIAKEFSDQGGEYHTGDWVKNTLVLTTADNPREHNIAATHVLVSDDLSDFDLSQGLKEPQATSVGQAGESISLVNLSDNALLKAVFKEIHAKGGTVTEADFETAFASLHGTDAFSALGDRGAYFIDAEAGKVYWYFGEIGVNNPITLSYDAQVQRPDATDWNTDVPLKRDLTSSATVYNLWQSDSDESNNSVSVAPITQAAIVDCGIEIQGLTDAKGNPLTLEPGKTYDYSIVLSNGGDKESVVRYEYSSWFFQDGNNMLQNGSVTIKAGESVVLPKSFTVPDSFTLKSQSIDTTAAITASIIDIKDPLSGATMTESTYSNNIDGFHNIDGSEHIVHNKDFDLALEEKIVLPEGEAIQPGGTYAFDITVYNEGAVDAHNVSIRSYIPEGWTFVKDNPGNAGWTAVSDSDPSQMRYTLTDSENSDPTLSIQAGEKGAPTEKTVTIWLKAPDKATLIEGVHTFTSAAEIEHADAIVSGNNLEANADTDSTAGNLLDHHLKISDHEDDSDTALLTVDAGTIIKAPPNPALAKATGDSLGAAPLSNSARIILPVTRDASGAFSGGALAEGAEDTAAASQHELTRQPGHIPGDEAESAAAPHAKQAADDSAAQDKAPATATTENVQADDTEEAKAIKALEAKVAAKQAEIEADSQYILDAFKATAEAEQADHPGLLQKLRGLINKNAKPEPADSES